MRVTEQILAVLDYGGEREEVMACCDSMEEARFIGPHFLESGTVTLCRIKIVEVVGTLEA